MNTQRIRNYYRRFNSVLKYGGIAVGLGLSSGFGAQVLHKKIQKQKKQKQRQIDPEAERRKHVQQRHRLQMQQVEKVQRPFYEENPEALQHLENTYNDMKLYLYDEEGILAPKGYRAVKSISGYYKFIPIKDRD